jgi:hypothetical protein
MTSRRHFISGATTALAATAVAREKTARARPPKRQPRSDGSRSYTGSDLLGWTTVVGDGVYAAPGEAGVSTDDIAVTNSGGFATLSANTRRRVVMAHTLAFTRVTDLAATSARHEVGFLFRMPYVPEVAAPDPVGQTVEGGFFVWDGAGSRLDQGAAFQWRVNPWAPDFGQVFAWSADADSGTWVPIGTLAVDTTWHEMRIDLDLRPDRQRCRLDIDGVVGSDLLARETKPDFLDDVSARLQVEIISVDPQPSNQIRSIHVGQFANWSWRWTAAGSR